MTPQEKAIELKEKMKMKDNSFDKKQQKHCAIIAVDEIIHLLNAAPIFNGTKQVSPDMDKVWAYWIEVKSQIEKL
jgi:hypothetical protein